MDKKLGAEASFFWECVRKGRDGVDFEGCSGRPPLLRDASDLFSSQPDSGIEFDQYDAIPVTRGGSAAAGEDRVPIISDFAEVTAQLPPFVARNLVGVDRMRYSKPTPIQAGVPRHLARSILAQ